MTIVLTHWFDSQAGRWPLAACGANVTNQPHTPAMGAVSCGRCQREISKQIDRRFLVENST